MFVQPVILTTPLRPHTRVAHITSAFHNVTGFAEPLVYRDERGEGAAIATRDALTVAGAAGHHVLFLEDDLLVDHEAPARIAATEFPDGVAAISFCDMREVSEFAPAGLYRCSALGSDGRGWWGNQALLIHRDTIAMSLEHDWFGDDVESMPGIRVHDATYQDAGRNCSDIRLALLIYLHGGERRHYAVSVPSVFKHVGTTSVCFPGRGMGERETRNWIADRRRFEIDARLDSV